MKLSRGIRKLECDEWCYVSMYVYRAVTILLICLCLVSMNSYGLTVHNSIAILINEHGVALVEMQIHLSDGLQIIEAPVEPIPETIIAVVNGELIPVIYENRTLYLFMHKSSPVSISYIANTSMVGSVFHLAIEINTTVTITVPILNIVLLTAPREIVSYRREGDTLILTIRGPQELRYTIRPPQTIPATPTPTPRDTHTTPQPTQSPTKQPDYTLWIFTAGFIAAAAVGILAIYIKKRRGRITETLSNVDITIIKILDAKGGSALQSELQSSINIPKTTLWRHIKRLEKLGIIRIEKVGLQNKITLIKKIKV